LQVQIIAVGKLKEKYLKDAVLEYTKRLSRFCSIEIVEVAEEKVPENLSKSEEDLIKDKEAQRIRKAIAKNAFVIALDLKGDKPDSIQFARKLSGFMLNGVSQFAFIIGGSIGLGEKLLKEADYNLCISNMTFTHQLARIILLEQLYRSFKIMNNETYHK